MSPLALWSEKRPATAGARPRPCTAEEERVRLRRWQASASADIHVAVLVRTCTASTRVAARSAGGTGMILTCLPVGVRTNKTLSHDLLSASLSQSLSSRSAWTAAGAERSGA